MTREHADLSEVATSTLERLRDAIASGRVKMPVTRTGLMDHGIRSQLEALEGALSGHTALACLSVLDVTLAERRKNVRPLPELVWTGPERTHATARDTAVVLRELFERAKQQVILAGFNFTKGSSLLEPLWVAMREREVDARFFIHIDQPSVTPIDPREYAANQAFQTMREAWPFGDPLPRIYYDARSVLAGPPYSSLHAKCVVVDGEVAFVTSANFTRRAQERNLECGVLLEDAHFAHHLARQWLGLIEAGLVFEAHPTTFVHC